MERAVVLLSGGVDSSTVLAIARAEGFACHALSFRYGQRHMAELRAAERVAAALGASSHRTIAVDLRAIGGSALTDAIDVPKDRTLAAMAQEIPVTYVPCRNLVFIALAAGLGETLGARHLFLGVNAIDYSGYPDCRPEFIEAVERTLAIGSKAGAEGRPFRIHTPLIHMTKAQIVRKGMELGLDFALTHSCYEPDAEGRACGACDSCILRRKGFEEAGVADPTRYREP